MRAALFAFSRGGCATARRVMAALPEAVFVCYTMERFEEPAFLPLDKAVYGACFSAMDALIFVGACGIAVREIAPYVQSKKTDPAVLCIDEAGPTRWRRRWRRSWTPRRWSPPPPTSAGNLPWTHGLPGTAAPSPT